MRLILNTAHSNLILCLIAFFTVALSACSMPNDIEANEKIAQQVIDTPGAIQNYVLYMEGPDGDFKLHYVSSDRSNTPRDTVVFIHGTPGDWSSFARYFQDEAFKDRFRIIAIDRPGWGKSTLSGHFPTALQIQSDMIGPMLENIWQRNGEQKIILVGHSLGGSLVPILAADYPEFVRGVVILAGDLEPSLAEARWYNILLDWTPSLVIPDLWNNSNIEVLELTNSLELAQPKLVKLTTPISLLQGTQDTLVDPKNAEYATHLFENSELHIEMIEGAGHIINLQHPDKVIKAIRDMNTRSSK